jgi:diguanylate cyclase (GGDEF)-like protein
VLPLLRNFESISSCRDRAKLPPLFLEVVKVLLGERTVAGIFSRPREPRHDGSLKFSLGAWNDGALIALWARLAGEIRHENVVSVAAADGWYGGALTLESSEWQGEDLILVFGRDRPLEPGDIDALASLARIFGNHIRLIDYSELDSLPRLLNRKTFDETFDRLLTRADVSSGESRCSERRLREAALPAWLATIDIDHFKRINDSFGHLFGDEVLLRMGTLMRKTFRGSDRLFRFGGEEFVVILNAPDGSSAELVFERFRSSVERHEFPQVGTVTCSLGYTAVSNLDIPVNVLGRADQALYFAKNGGRNLVCCYERLLDRGLIVPAAPADIGVDADIDELFG